MLKVKVHCGSGHVQGRARQFPYFVSSLFVPYKTKAGHWVYRNSGVTTHPRRSIKLCEQDGKELAEKFPMCSFEAGYGSLHNQRA